MNVNRFFHTLFYDSLGLESLGLLNRCQELVKLIDRRTLPAFSDMVPAKYLTYLDLGDRSKIVKKEFHTRGVEYRIEDPIIDKFDLPILGVEKMRYNNVSGVDPYDPDSTAYYNSLITSRQNLTLDGLLMGSEYTYNRTLADNATPFKPFKDYRGGGVLYVENWAYHGMVELQIKTAWPNIVSIPDEYSEPFLQLAEYDCKIHLWNDLRYIEDVPTPDGNLQLRFNWEGQDKERLEFLKEFRAKSLPDRVGPRYFQLL